MSKQLLPIGSVVLLNNGKKHLMIYGVLPIRAEDSQVFDYVGCLYPEGYISSEHCYMFNHKDIDEVIFLGHINSEQQVFSSKLNDFLEAKETGDGQQSDS